MGYNKEKWERRIEKRPDLSTFVYHLTKEVKNEDEKCVTSPVESLLKILKERTLIGSDSKSGFINGDRKAVCFQDAPIAGIVQNVLHENEFKEDLKRKNPYTHVGLAFPKFYIYDEGGRPVIYENKSTAMKMLPKEEYWRIVDFNLNDSDKIIDWTHEREWRMPVDEFKFKLDEVIILVSNQNEHQEVIEKLPKEDLKSILGMIQISAIAL